jgi:uncharacterized protein (DUF1330 family)
MSKTAKGYYQLVFIWMKDPEKFARYGALALPIVQRYGGGIERMIAPDAVYADGMTKPDIVNVAYYDDKAAFEALAADPDFRAVLPLRSEAITMISVEGTPRGAGVTTRGADRVYVVEVAQYGERGAAGYAEYAREAETLMRGYGYHEERTIEPDAPSGFSFRPDIVRVASFENQAAMDRMHSDPAHPRIEQELYPAAVKASAWVVGRMHPATLG